MRYWNIVRITRTIDRPNVSSAEYKIFTATISTASFTIHPKAGQTH